MHEETIKQWDRDNAGEPQIAPEGIECPKHVAIVGLAHRRFAGTPSA